MRALLAAVLVGLSIAYLAQALETPWADFRASAFALGPASALALVAGSFMTLALSVAYHVMLVRQVGDRAARALHIASAYAAGQIVRYVPGKVFGVMFQVGALRGSVLPGSVLAALLVQAAHDFAWTFVFCGAVVWALVVRSAWPLLLLLPAVAGLHMVHRCALSFRAIRGVPLLARHLPPASDASQTGTPSRAAGMTLVQSMVWLPMLAGAWFAFLPLFGAHGSLLAALLYIAAAVLSLLAVVVPSGLVVREATYVWLGGLVALPPDKLLFAAVATRLGMTAAELLLAIAVIALARAGGRAGDRHG